MSMIAQAFNPNSTAYGVGSRRWSPPAAFNSTYTSPPHGFAAVHSHNVEPRQPAFNLNSKAYSVGSGRWNPPAALDSTFSSPAREFAAIHPQSVEPGQRAYLVNSELHAIDNFSTSPSVSDADPKSPVRGKKAGTRNRGAPRKSANRPKMKPLGQLISEETALQVKSDIGPIWHETNDSEEEDDDWAARSLGSSLHGKGGCVPCKFLFTLRGCRDGTQCNRCHYPHSEMSRSARRKNIRRTRLAALRLAAGQISQPVTDTSASSESGGPELEELQDERFVSKIQSEPAPGACYSRARAIGYGDIEDVGVKYEMQVVNTFIQYIACPPRLRKSKSCVW